MADSIVVLNAGSSSIKFSLFSTRGADLELELRGQIEGIDTAPHFIAKDAAGRVQAERSWADGVELGHDAALDHLLGFMRSELSQHDLVGVGHRVVHGGRDYANPVRVDAGVLAILDQLVALAPLHQPHNLAPMRLLLERVPALPQVACFDTSFHRTNPHVAQMFALSPELFDEGVQRYGFHGLSYEYIVSVLPSLDPRAATGNTIVLHLGNGASMCAIASGRSMTSTMGFTPVDGLPMGTRCGALDTGVILYLMDRHGMDARMIEKLIYNQSGLLGVSGVSSDMRTLIESDAPRARLAIDLFVYRIGRELGSLAAALQGLDALVFTGGIGENAAVIRSRVCHVAAWLGVDLDDDANANGGPRITTARSKVSAWVIPTNEELMIARHTQALLAG